MRPGPAGLSTAPVAALFLTPDQQLVAVNADGALGVHRWVTPRSEFGSFTFSAAYSGDPLFTTLAALYLPC